MNRWIIALLTMLAIAGLAVPNAEAQTSVAGLAGYGVDFEGQDLHPFGVSLGARAGHTLPMKLYLGAAGVFHVGGTEETAGIESTLRMLQLGVELGYDAQLSDALVLRPYAGLGLNVGFASNKKSVAGTKIESSDSETDLYLNVGAALLYSLNESLFIGCDVRSANVMIDPEALNGLVVMATVGTSF